MEKALRALNALQQEGLIRQYAIGGGIAATFYIEPVLTYDLDVFVRLPESGSGLVSLSAIYERLRRKGCQPRREHLMVEGIAVQLIPIYSALIDEAVAKAVERKVNKTRTRVVRAEHLVAIMLQTGRSKDYARAIQMLEQAKMDEESLLDILRRHGLAKKWKEFGSRFRHGKTTE